MPLTQTPYRADLRRHLFARPCTSPLIAMTTMTATIVAGSMRKRHCKNTVTGTNAPYTGSGDHPRAAAPANAKCAITITSSPAVLAAAALAARQRW